MILGLTLRSRVNRPHYKPFLCSMGCQKLPSKYSMKAMALTISMHVRRRVWPQTSMFGMSSSALCLVLRGVSIGGPNMHFSTTDASSLEDSLMLVPAAERQSAEVHDRCVEDKCVEDKCVCNFVDVSFHVQASSVFALW